MWGCTPTISTPGGRCRRISGSSRPARAAVSGVSSHLDCVSPLGSLEVCHYLLEFGLPTGTVPTVSRAHRLGQFAQVSSEERRASGVRCLEPLAQSWPESWLLLPVINTVPSGRLHFREPSSRKQSKKEREKKFKSDLYWGTLGSSDRESQQRDNTQCLSAQPSAGSCRA